MRKIKNFKVPIYYYDILRKARKNGIIKQSIDDEEEKNLKETISNAISRTNLSSVYSNLTIDDFENIIKTREYSPDPKKTKVISIGAISLGKEIDNFIDSNNEEEKKLIDISIDVYLKTALNALVDMICEEAKKDNLELSTPFFLYSPFEIGDFIGLDSGLEPVLKEIKSEKIGMTLNGEKIEPRYTLLFFIEWNLKKKK